MLAKGSLAETELRSLLETAQTERAIGTLNLRRGSESSTLYFLFGHLFHAVGDGQVGDEVVVRALRWPGGEFDFDAKAKLPADETVRLTIGELVEKAAAGGEAEAAVEEAVQVEEPAAQTVPSPTWASPEPAPTFSEPLPADPPTPTPPAFEAEPASDEPPLRLGVKHRPQPKHGREPVPVPAGETLYDSLKTSFVDFPRLITTLEREGYTGYVRLQTENAAGLIFFREGRALECLYDAGADPTFLLGRTALREFNEEVTRGQGILDVVSLSPQLVDGLFQLTVARPVYTELYASWVDMNALLAFLEARHLSGSLMVRGSQATGVIILDEGHVAGAYTSDSREISETPEGVLALCEEPDAMIEVKAEGTASHEPLDVDDIVGSRRGATRPMPPPPAPQAVPPVAQAPAPPPRQPDPEPPPPPPQSAPLPPIPILVPQDVPAVEAPTTPALPVVGRQAPIDWEALVVELQQMTDEALGNRSRKVKDVLGGAQRSKEGLETAISQVPSISILFVDSSRLEALAGDLQTRLKTRLS